MARTPPRAAGCRPQRGRSGCGSGVVHQAAGESCESIVEHSSLLPLEHGSVAAPWIQPSLTWNQRRTGRNRLNTRRKFQHGRPIIGGPKRRPRPMGCETLTNVSPMSRREFIAATTTVVGGGLAAACASDPPSPPDTKSVLIVGAGMAGLSAARSLTDAGWPARCLSLDNCSATTSRRSRSRRRRGPSTPTPAAPTHSTPLAPASTTGGSCRSRSATGSIWRVRPSASTIRPP